VRGFRKYFRNPIIYALVILIVWVDCGHAARAPSALRLLRLAKVKVLSQRALNYDGEREPSLLGPLDGLRRELGVHARRE
jgi:hypothetical protein